MIQFVPGDPYAKDTRAVWHGAIVGAGEKRTANVACPQCSMAFSLIHHTIGPDGIVSPSVVCGYKCGFHAFIRLEGWSPETNPPMPLKRQPPPVY